MNQHFNIIIFALLISVSSVAADHPGNDIITPEDGFLWELELFWEDVRAGLMFNKENRAMFLLERAEHRSLEVEHIESESSGRDLTDAELNGFRRALVRHEVQMGEARQLGAESNSLRVIRRIESRAAAIDDTYLVVLRDLRSRVPEDDAGAIDVAIEMTELTSREARGNLEEVRRQEARQSDGADAVALQLRVTKIDRVLQAQALTYDRIVPTSVNGASQTRVTVENRGTVEAFERSVTGRESSGGRGGPPVGGE